MVLLALCRNVAVDVVVDVEHLQLLCTRRCFSVSLGTTFLGLTAGAGVGHGNGVIQRKHTPDSDGGRSAHQTDTHS